MQFWTVLRPADQEPIAGEGVAAFFCRQDYCESCIESVPEGEYFARWKTSVPAPTGPPRRIVNLASLHATFLSLIDAKNPVQGSAELDPQSPSQAQQEPQSDDPGVPTGGLAVSREADRVRLAYLLALFLVRKKALRWQQHGGDHLVVCERSGELYQVPVPGIDSGELEAAVTEFEELLG